MSVPSNQWERSCFVSLPSAMGKDECKTMLDALNKVTACYRHLVIALGSTSDSQNLREELKRTRKKAQDKDDRAEYERLWVLFSSSMELLEVDMKRSLEIGQDFPLKVPTRHLIQTGMTGSTTTVAARAMSVQNMKYEADSNIDTADLRDLQCEISQVSQMMEEMEMKVQVAPWAVEAKQEAGAELKSNMSSLGDLREVHSRLIMHCKPVCVPFQGYLANSVECKLQHVNRGFVHTDCCVR
uniref:Regulator of G protein signaling 9 binding protein n=1 Tax=Cyclopterus lumpus TaxID=8103 RepID=A0A8C2WV23_CYCLU